MKCFKQKWHRERKAHAHLNNSVINRSFKTSGKSFTNRSVPNNVTNTNVAVIKIQWKGRNIIMLKWQLKYYFVKNNILATTVR
jgi:hypothetical protein